ncbi:hypothetical protein M422DRAFT_70073 [Sphaerobolus stellatus SS14]|uniref:Unplaced genomic scaffold SPHSTscaffold_120, whole genome shotgun sequence n=1 Tax=Sphaerobolus stellatus (strain SS14) TaxID=990650 RepID=A0A0C9TWL6_SPHS4|nr:hypothetical protein M422DRAFT_70073 [Sphaerobolus stellatus SS14]
MAAIPQLLISIGNGSTARSSGTQATSLLNPGNDALPLYKRTPKACLECRRDKSRCDAGRPCSGCIKKGREDFCLDGCYPCRVARSSCDERRPCHSCFEAGKQCSDDRPPEDTPRRKKRRRRLNGTRKVVPQALIDASSPPLSPHATPSPVVPITILTVDDRCLGCQGAQVDCEGGRGSCRGCIDRGEACRYMDTSESNVEIALGGEAVKDINGCHPGKPQRRACTTCFNEKIPCNAGTSPCTNCRRLRRVCVLPKNSGGSSTVQPRPTIVHKTIRKPTDASAAPSTSTHDFFSESISATLPSSSSLLSPISHIHTPEASTSNNVRASHCPPRATVSSISDDVPVRLPGIASLDLPVHNGRPASSDVNPSIQFSFQSRLLPVPRPSVMSVPSFGERLAPSVSHLRSTGPTGNYYPGYY